MGLPNRIHPGHNHNVEEPIRLVSPRTHKTAKKLKYYILFFTMLISITLGLSLYLGMGSDYKNALDIFATGPFTAISPDGTLFRYRSSAS